MTFPTPFHPLFVLMFQPPSNPVPTPFQRCSIVSPIPPTPVRARERGARAWVRGRVIGAKPGGRPVDFMDRTDGHPAGLGMVPMPGICLWGGLAERAVPLSLPTFWKKIRGVC